MVDCSSICSAAFQALLRSVLYLLSSRRLVSRSSCVLEEHACFVAGATSFALQSRWHIAFPFHLIFCCVLIRCSCAFPVSTLFQPALSPLCAIMDSRERLLGSLVLWGCLPLPFIVSRGWSLRAPGSYAAWRGRVKGLGAAICPHADGGSYVRLGREQHCL